MALRHHPDITADADAVATMAELIAAFDLLVGSDLSQRVGRTSWGQLALHCEIYSTQQLRRTYDVRTVRLEYDSEFHDEQDPCEQDLSLQAPSSLQVAEAE
eukprot:SAG31_NODE_22948_length_514_cov_1.291566_1_plen_100_part_10